MARRPLHQRYRRFAPIRRCRYAYGYYWNRFVWGHHSAPGGYFHGCACDQCAEARRKWG